MNDRSDVRRFEALVLPHLGTAYNLARWLTGSDDDADGVTQESCLRAYRIFGSFHGSSARSWLLRIVRDDCFSRLHQRALDVRLLDINDVLDLPSDGDVDQASALGQISVRAMTQALESLPIEYREAIVLRDVEQLSYREIAEVTDIPLGAVMPRLRRARRRLRQTLSGHRVSPRNDLHPLKRDPGRGV